jgi:exopolyphosphatase / guanosine-5'-triphosphate,3'-diphosphate pyrophosphatase
MEMRPRAVLDIGSNTIRLLVARPEEDRLVPLVDRSEFVRLGRNVDRSGELQADRIDAAVSAIRALQDLAREMGVEETTAIATSAVRDAGNGKAFAEAVREKTGLEVRILSGEEEAELTFLGATLGMPLDGGAVIVDLGGGSAEVVLAKAASMEWARSLQLGSGRLTERFIEHDPPEPDELDALAAHVRAQLRGLPAASAQSAIFTGGTATHIAVLERRSDPLVCMTRDDLGRVLEIVRTQSSQQLVDGYSIRPERAQVLPAGICTLATIAGFYRVDCVVITRQGLREGAIVAILRREGIWR